MEHLEANVYPNWQFVVKNLPRGSLDPRMIIWARRKGNAYCAWKQLPDLLFLSEVPQHMHSMLIAREAIANRRSLVYEWIKATKRWDALVYPYRRALRLRLQYQVAWLEKFDSSLASQSLPSPDSIQLTSPAVQSELKNNGLHLALVKASMDNSFQDISTLLHAGADVNIRDSEGMTALMVASKNGHSAIVEQLINAGADVNAKADDGWTAIYWASRNGRSAIVELLINAGADLNIQEREGATALQAVS